MKIRLSVDTRWCTNKVPIDCFVNFSTYSLCTIRMHILHLQTLCNVRCICRFRLLVEAASITTLLQAFVEVATAQQTIAMNQVRSEASSSGSNNSNVSTPVAKDFTSHRILYPISETPPEGNRVKWIGLHPLEMVDQIMSMANHSANARSATHSIDEVFMKRVASTTPPAIAVLPSSTKEKNEMFQTKMSNWLLQNWTNPFPDTAALNFLANHLLQAQCIVVKANDAHVLAGKSFEERQRYMMKKACKKIETYLVNSRLRKWRKSIEDAFDLVRSRHSMFSLDCFATSTFLTLFMKIYIVLIRGVQHIFFLKTHFVYVKGRHCDPLRVGTRMYSLLLMLDTPYH